MSGIDIYAEILPNIRQASLYASLQTPKNEHTKIDIGSDKRTVTVSHQGQSATVHLPSEINGCTQLGPSAGSDKELSARLTLSNTADLSYLPETSFGSEAPWSARELSQKSRIRCRFCSVEFLLPTVDLLYKDLPSENWAEMMELWHCHKPHDHIAPDAQETAEAAANSKGYGSLTRLNTSTNTVFVDIATFLLAGSSCMNIQVGAALFLQHHPFLAFIYNATTVV